LDLSLTGFQKNLEIDAVETAWVGIDSPVIELMDIGSDVPV
jgi:hypothetical protein|tara:strand:- start:9417 stop:9539 length:123 start_codon:yes stop_codon:yes gene_type:complete